MMLNPNDKWYWAYLHQNGTVLVKRWSGDHEDYRGDCIGNPCVQKVKEPFRAQNMQEAIIFAKSDLEFDYDR